MPVATVWTAIPTPSESTGYGLDSYGTAPYGNPSTGDTILTTWTEIVQTT